MNWTILLTIASIVGTAANVLKRRWAFGVWICTNSLWCGYDISIRQYPQAALFAVYLGLAIWGLFSWGRDPSLRSG
jgi:nicotinamide riboside transporter PnuC